MTDAIIGLVGVVVGGFLTGGLALLKQHFELKSHARYLAMRVVCILDRFAQISADVASDDGLCEGRRDSEDRLKPQVPTPATPSFPDDLAWNSIDYGLMYAILAFPGQVEEAKRFIDYAGDYDFFLGDEYMEERRLQHARLGLTAIDLAGKLRKTYSIPPLSRFTETFNRLTDEREALQEKRDVRDSRAIPVPYSPNVQAISAPA